MNTLKKWIIVIFTYGLCLAIGYMADHAGGNKRERYSISIGDTTLQVIRKIKIGHEDSKVLDIRTIYPGKNCYYFQLNEDVDLDVIIME